MNKRDMWVPLKEKKNIKAKSLDGDHKDEIEELKKFYFYSLSFLSQIPEFLTVRIRRDKYEKCSTRLGLRVSTRNIRFH